MEALWRDIRHALRRLRNSRGFTLATIISLGLGIGANSAIFSLLNVLTLQPMAVNDPQRLVRIGPVDNHFYVNFVRSVPAPLLDHLRANPLLAGVCGVSTPLTTVEIDGRALPVGALSLSGDCYETLGVRPALGRLFTHQDDVPGAPRVVALSYGFWRGQFGADPNVIGKNVSIEGSAFRIIGVIEPRFHGMLFGYPPSISLPITQEINPLAVEPSEARDSYWAFAFARLKPGVTVKQLRAELSTQWRGLLNQTLPERMQGAERDELLNLPLAVSSGATGLDYMMRYRFQSPLLAALAISAVVLLASCLNVANLLLARGLQRRREIAVRLALGARRWRIVRELLVESSILIAGGLCCALLVTQAGVPMLIEDLSRSFWRFEVAANLDWRVLLFASGVAVTALLLFGVAPACQASAVNLTDALKSGGNFASGAQGGTRRMLICAQVALTLVLISGAVLFTETLRNLRHESLGLRADSLLDVQLMPLAGGYVHGFDGATYYRELLERMRALPGVRSASLSHFAPLLSNVAPEEIRIARSGDAIKAEAPIEPVTDGFLAELGVSLLEGRDFDRSATPESQKTAIVSESLARRLFPTGSAVGQHIRLGADNRVQDVEIVGVAADARLTSARAKDLAFVYTNYWQYPNKYQGWPDLELRFSGEAGNLIKGVRQILHDGGHEYALRVQTLAEQRDTSLLEERLLASLGTVYGILALTLSGIGLFGLLSFLIANRTTDFGIRMALGAEWRDISWLVIRESLALIGFGLVFGLPLAYAAARALAGLLYRVGPFPVEAFMVAIAVLLIVGAAATVIPVRRATAVDPMVALKYE